ncbi:monovalent cation/H+ antiporter subunit E [Corynebacterium uterequi]|uniref:Multisubunit sodium/proton antiporter, MrpE subunit n=1 Tax=Corynebacterium uterequi TaxID=1072256 RepID=A0A0G3HGD4_9CORY|nr:monovalent cation/H+ antiporter subunit E [Corynebacterium uterequi]AKK10177.1 multisubunit sodium/proton antiporter, MrpE subunit [Corynebacterium uterequi]
MHAIVYIAWLIKEIFAAGFAVAARALRPDIGFTPMVVRYPLRVTSDWEIFWFSTSITATPSTLSLGLREPARPGDPRILLVQDAFGDDPAEITRGLADMEVRLAPHVAGIDHGVPGQGSAEELPIEYYDYTSPRRVVK